jgi:hypothetical protein
MVVPTKIWKEDDNEIALMVFPSEDFNIYEFQLVKFSSNKTEVLKEEKYRVPLDIEKIANDFKVEPECVKELLKKLGYKSY